MCKWAKQSAKKFVSNNFGNSSSLAKVLGEMRKVDCREKVHFCLESVKHFIKCVSKYKTRRN